MNSLIPIVLRKTKKPSAKQCRARITIKRQVRGKTDLPLIAAFNNGFSFPQWEVGPFPGIPNDLRSIVLL